MLKELTLKNGKQILYLQVIRSNRKSIGLEVRSADDIRVRIPSRLSDRELKKFVNAHKDWIFEKAELIENWEDQRTSTGAPSWEGLSKVELQNIKNKFADRVSYFAEIMNVTFGRITIRNQKTRWGSCSTKGNLNFNYQLYYLPDELLDYVVVHELSHRRHMDHSKEFWTEVEKYCPNYRKLRKNLKKYTLI